MDRRLKRFFDSNRQPLAPEANVFTLENEPSRTLLEHFLRGMPRMMHSSQTWNRKPRFKSSQSLKKCVFKGASIGPNPR